ncbi:MAG: right-handed parallel beta-helix repeat-containing protein [Armatimonadota bacterium]|nr:right-handed parallel beta-helix repeat-containing protein [Armatimonadota bacterium]
MRNAVSAAALAALIVTIGCPAMGQVNQEMIDRVAEGEVTEAKASWWGFDPEDSTEALQAAIDSGVEKLIVEDMGQPWIVTPIQLASNQEIVFEEGCEILAKRGEFKGGGDTLFTARGTDNVTLRGYGATWRMWQEDYDNPELYEKAEWRHCLSLRGASNISVYGLLLTESGGDGIYLGRGEGGATNLNVHIKDVVCDNNYRQGISVITAENLLIEDTIMRNTSGTPPQAGIDFEPNRPDERLVNVVMRNCLTENNNGSGYTLYLRSLNADSEPVSIRFENCRAASDHGYAASVTTDSTIDSAVGGTIEFVGCELEGSNGAGIGVAKPAEQGLVRFIDCTVRDVAAEQPTVAPIIFRSGRGAADAVGGVHFENVVVQDPLDRNPMGYVDQGGGIPLKMVTGTLVLVDEEGQRTEVELTEELLAEWMPVAALKDIPRLSLEGMSFEPLVPDSAAAVAEPVRWPWLRRQGHFALYAQEGEEVSFLAKFAQVGNYAGDEMPVTVTGPSGAEVHSAAVPFQSEATVRFTAPQTGLYRIDADAGQNRLQLSGASHPMAIVGEEAPIRLIHSAGDFRFYVPPGVTEFGVRISGEGTGEAIRAALINPLGETVEEVDNQFQTHQFEVELPDPSEGQVWTLRLAKPSAMTWEDHYVDLRGVPPLLTPAGTALIVPAQG